HKVFALHAMAANEAAKAAVQIVISMFVENSVTAGASRADQMRAVAMQRPETAGFNLLAIGMLRWSLASYHRDPNVPVPPPIDYALASDLDAIADYLNEPGQLARTFTYDRLAAFIEKNYQLRVGTPLGVNGMVP